MTAIITVDALMENVCVYTGGRDPIATLSSARTTVIIRDPARMENASATADIKAKHVSLLIARITAMAEEYVIFKRERVSARMGILEMVVRKLTAQRIAVGTESVKLTGSVYATRDLKERTAVKARVPTDARVKSFVRINLLYYIFKIRSRLLCPEPMHL